MVIKKNTPTTNAEILVELTKSAKRIEAILKFWNVLVIIWLVLTILGCIILFFWFLLTVVSAS